jgi:hypothetical protein
MAIILFPSWRRKQARLCLAPDLHQYLRQSPSVCGTSCRIESTPDFSAPEVAVFVLFIRAAGASRPGTIAAAANIPVPLNTLRRDQLFFSAIGVSLPQPLRTMILRLFSGYSLAQGALSPIAI